MTKEEAIYIPNSDYPDESIEDYYKRIEDPNNYGDERWMHIFCDWWNHVLDITWDDSFYDNILIKIKEGYESTIRDFVELRYSEGIELTPMMETFKPLTKENYKEILYPNPVKKEKRVKLL